MPHKEVDNEWICDQVCRDLVRLGLHGTLVMRSDQEPEILDVLKEIARLRGEKRTILQCSAVGDSQGNGFAERSVQMFEEMVRVMKLSFETRIDERISVRHPLFAWIVGHAAETPNKYHLGADGRTPVQRLSGNRSTTATAEFGSKVMARVCGKVQGGNMSARWFAGHWLGRKSGTEEHVVMTEEGAVVRVRALREMDEKISLEDFKVLVAVPSDPMATRRLASSALDRKRGEPGEEDRGREEHMPKRVHITKEVVKNVPTRGCRKCR